MRTARSNDLQLRRRRPLRIKFADPAGFLAPRRRTARRNHVGYYLPGVAAVPFQLR